MRLFFRIFFCRQTVLPSSFFDILQQTEVSKSPMGPLSSFSALWDFQNSHFSFYWIFFKKFSNFSFVAKRSPLQVFWHFAANWSFKKPKGSPLSSFRHCETVSKFLFFVFPKVFSKKFPNFFIVSFNFFDILQQTGFSKSWKGPPFYKFKNLALFWALDIAPTLDVPILLLVALFVGGWLIKSQWLFCCSYVLEIESNKVSPWNCQ